MAEIWINNPFDNLPEEGAKPQRYSSLAAELARRGHSVTWWTADFSHQKKARRQNSLGEILPAAYVRGDGVKMRLVPTPPYASNVSPARVLSHKAYARMWFALSSQMVARGELQKPDVILVSSPPLSTYPVAATIRKYCGCKIVLDLMDAWPDAFEGVLPLPAKLKRVAAKLLFAGARKTVRKAHLGADLVTGVSESYLNLARKNGATVPMAAFRHSCAALHPPASTASMPPLRLAYVGNMGPSYDLVTAVSAVKALVEDGTALTFDLAGSGPGESVLREMARGCDAIRFHGFLGAAELSALLERSHAGLIPLLPSSAVAIPYKLPDYASHGLASVSCLDGESAALIADYHAGLPYAPHDVASLATVLKALADAPEKLPPLREGALRLAEEKFLASRIYPAFADIIEGVL